MLSLLRESLAAFSLIRDEISNVISESKASDARYCRFATGQMHYYGERCQSLNLLLQDGKLWDADILMRAATECATRFIFVSIAEPNERMNRIDEYEFALIEIDDLQRSEKAKPAVAASMDSNTAMLLGGAVLSPVHEAELRARWPKTKRKELKQKWSFSEMVRQLSEFNNDRLDLRHYKSLLHSYGLSSHLIHADQTAIDLVWDRKGREPHIRRMQEQAHFARLAASQVSLLFLCWRAIAFVTDFDSKNPEPVKRLLALNEQADVFHRAFAESQAHLYPCEGTEAARASKARQHQTSPGA
jgi:hypothetical protein